MFPEVNPDPAKLYGSEKVLRLMQEIAMVENCYRKLNQYRIVIRQEKFITVRSVVQSQRAFKSALL